MTADCRQRTAIKDQRPKKNKKSIVRTNIPILIVEDDPERQKILKNLLKSHAWILAHTAERAIRMIQAYHFDMIFLDFDLAGSGKGEDVARAICQTENKKATILIHSMNGPGAEKIKLLLPQAVWVPINQITRSNAVFKRLKQEIGRLPDIDWKAVFREK
jgi:CheY-like chemotaxis protein